MGTILSFAEFNALARQPSVAKADTFLNAPLYYALTGRKGAVLHRGYGAVLVTCAHPHVEGRVMVFPEIGDAARGRLAAAVLTAMGPQPGGVQLARHTEAEIEIMKEALRQRNGGAVDHVAVVPETMMDWAYPVHILDTSRIAAMDGPCFTTVRNKFRRAAEVVTETIPLSDPRAFRALRAVLKYWEGSRIMRGLDCGDLCSFYNALFEAVSAAPDECGGLVFMGGHRPLGFTVYDRPFGGTANLIANLGDAAVTGLADFRMVATCRALAGQGVGLLNTGGAETENLDAFKRKYQPVRSLCVLSAEVCYAPSGDAGVVSSVFIPPRSS